MLICPVCGKKINKKENTYSCENGHAFDTAKEGYVNLLTGKHKSGSLIGDNKDMAKSRRSFLSGGYYDFLAETVAENGCGCKKLLDISCGEGYYTNIFKERTNADVYGFDISKEMIKLAAKKYKDVNFFVANIAHIPVESESVDCAVQICAPFCESEFARILSRDGVLMSVVPGKMHLWELKKVLYDTAYENNDDMTEHTSLKLIKSETVKSEICLDNHDDIDNLFKMTPYYYKTSAKDKAKLDALTNLTTQAEFVIRYFVRSI